MANSFTYGFGSGNSLPYTQQELSVGSQYFTTKDSELLSKLGSEVFKGEFSVADGLTAFDNAPLLASGADQATTTNQAKPSPPSTRPYIWKYQ